MISKKQYRKAKDKPFINFVFYFHIVSIYIAFIGAIYSQNVIAAENKPITDDAFVRDIFVNAQTEIEISRIALSTSKNSDTRRTAKIIIKDNSSANDKLRILAGDRRLPVPALNKNTLLRIDHFRNMAADKFDEAYRKQMQQTHDAAIALFDNVARNPQADAELRVFASQRLPAFKKQRQIIDKIAGVPSRSANATLSRPQQIAGRNKVSPS